MRLAMFHRDGNKGIAAAENQEFRGITEDHPEYPGSLDRLLAQGSDLNAVAKRLLAGAPVIDLDSVTLLPPLQAPGKILCIGLNYADHSAEAGFDAPAYPTVFTRFTSTLVAHKAPLVRPAQSEKFDYEGEMVAVIGRGGRYIQQDRALDHVAAYSIFNDVSVRDYQFKSPQWTMGKNFDHTGAFGPWLVTAESLPKGARGLRLQTRLNGDVVQDAMTDDMIFDVATLVSLISEVMTLEAGDIIVTGTPSGVGMARKPPLYMKAGDRCEVDIEGIGVLSNTVSDEQR